MKKLLILGTVLLGLCAIGQPARAGDDGPDYSYQRRAPERAQTCDEPFAAYPRFYLPPPQVFFRPVPRILFYAHPRYRRYYYCEPYAYGRAPGVHIGIGF